MMKAVGVRNFNKVKNGQGKLKAFADVMFSLRDDGDAVFTVSGCKLLEGQNGLFVAMPSESYENKDGETKWKNIVYIDVKEDEDARALQNSINEVVLAEWKKGSSSSSRPSKTQQTEGSFDDKDLDW